MSERVPARDIERIVGVKRHQSQHIIRGDYATGRALILHPHNCLARWDDLRDCSWSLALDRGDAWLPDDKPHYVRVRDGLSEADGAGVEVPVGRGEVDWESVLASLAEAGYAGWLTPDRTTGEDPAADAAKAVTYIKRVMPF